MATAPGRACVKGHSAFIYDRGGSRRLFPLVDLSSVRWERNRDGVSEAQIVVEGNACRDQAGFLERIATHRHELVIYRGDERVWEGPVHRVGWHQNYVEVTAHDVIEYLMFTPLSRRWSNAYPNIQTVTERLRDIIEYELTNDRTQMALGVPTLVKAWENIDPPVNLVAHVDAHRFLNEAQTSAVTEPFELTVGEHMANMAHYGGIDFTAVGRSIHIWDVSRALGRTVQLTEENFLSEIIVSEYGADHAQSAYVVGNEGVFGSALKTDNLDFYGPWTKIYTAYNEEGTNTPTQGELNSQALRNLAGRTPAPVEVRVPDNSGLLLSDDIRITDLIPGVQVPIRATLNARQYSQMQKIDHVVVTETGDSGETIQITLVPTTRQDADEELPEPERRIEVGFPGNSNYRLHASASVSGDSVLVKARVRLNGWRKPVWDPVNNEWIYSGVKGEDQPWALTQEMTPGNNSTKSGTWDYDFRFAPEKIAAAVQFDNVASGVRTFSVTVDMGSGIGQATASGTVEVY